MRVLVLAALVIAPAGCSSTCSVNGEVTYEGVKVNDGMITFLPADGKGPTAGGPISQGRFSVDRLTPGKKIVQITAVKEVPFARSSEEMAKRFAAAKAKGDGSGLIDPADLIPPHAIGNNVTVEVTPGTQTLNFALKKPKPR